MVTTNFNPPEEYALEEYDGAAAEVILLLAPVPMHGSPSYAAALEEVRHRHPDAEVVPDAGLWEGLDDWKANYKATLRELAPTDLYMLAAPDGTVGRGVHTMYLLLSRSGVSCRAALFPTAPGEPFETIEGFALQVADNEDWRRYAFPVPAAKGEGADRV